MAEGKRFAKKSVVALSPMGQFRGQITTCAAFYRGHRGKGAIERGPRETSCYLHGFDCQTSLTDAGGLGSPNARGGRNPLVYRLLSIPPPVAGRRPVGWGRFRVFGLIL